MFQVGSEIGSNMSGPLTFIYSLIASLIWPVVVLIIYCTTRESWKQLIERLAKFKTPVAEGEFSPPVGITPQAMNENERSKDAGSGIGNELEAIRLKQYSESEGLFLAHVKYPTREQVTPPASPRRRVYRVAVFVVGHSAVASGEKAPIDEIESVEYQLGPRFGMNPAISTDHSNGFLLTTSAYGPFVCVARVNFKSEARDNPVILKTYIDLPSFHPFESSPS